MTQSPLRSADELRREAQASTANGLQDELRQIAREIERVQKAAARQCRVPRVSREAFRALEDKGYTVYTLDDVMGPQQTVISW